MLQRVLTLTSLLAVFALLSISMWAKSNSNRPINATIYLSAKTNLSNTTLAPGQYTVKVQSDHATFIRDGKTVAEVPCTLKTLPEKNSQTDFLLDGNTLQEIRVAGKTEAVEFQQNKGSGA